MRAARRGRRWLLAPLGVLLLVPALPSQAAVPPPAAVSSPPVQAGQAAPVTAEITDAVDLLLGRGSSAIEDVDLSSDMIGSAATARLWRGGRVRYTSALPTAYAWSLRQAVAAWNSSGTGVRLVAASPSRASVRIGLTTSSLPSATVGRVPGARVAVPRFEVASWADREALARLLTHELGHVLGLGHRTRASSVMSAGGGRSRLMPWGRYACRWVQRGEGRAAARTYGGRFTPAPRACAFQPTPPQLADVTWSGGSGDAGDPVSVRWSVPAGLAPDSRVVVWAQERDTCDARTRFTRMVAVLDPADGAWTSSDAPGRQCVRVQLMTSSGVPAPPVVAWRGDAPSPDPAPEPAPDPAPEPPVPTVPPAPTTPPAPNPEPPAPTVPPTPTPTPTPEPPAPTTPPAPSPKPTPSPTPPPAPSPTPTPTPTPAPSPSPTPTPTPTPAPSPSPTPTPTPTPTPEPVVRPDAPTIEWLWFDRAFAAWIVQGELPASEVDASLVWAKGPMGQCPQSWPTSLDPLTRVLPGMGDDDDDSAWWLEATIGSTDCLSFFTLTGDGRLSKAETYQLPDGGYDLE